ncbi:MAG: CoA protein activase [Chloroflexi bacterium]|nr:CoA protein activase [Chloroflexota bacterium]MCL5075241.1 CoA protein activase [Chloroflexota bacterium]
MKVTLPHMGNIYVAFSALFRALNIDFVIPPPCSRRTLSLGARHSPEFVCVPFKLTLGNYIEGLELGADTLLMAAGPGLCRFGYYAKLQAEVLRELGFQFQVVDTQPFEGGRITGIAKKIRWLANDAPWPKVIAAVRFALAKIAVLDDLERIIHCVRARELVKGTATKVWQEAIRAIDVAADSRTLHQTKTDYIEKLGSIPIAEDEQPLRVGIIGEFYVVLEPFSNGDVEIELGKLGVEVARTMFVSEWTKISLFLSALGLSPKREIFRAANPYLKRDVGGDGWESVGETVLYATHGFDGMVHLAPFTCMPEIIAQNILPTVSRQSDIPVLTITCDEQMGRAGLVTRLEAFVDLMRRRRRAPLHQGRGLNLAQSRKGR